MGLLSWFEGRQITWLDRFVVSRASLLVWRRVNICAQSRHCLPLMSCQQGWWGWQTNKTDRMSLQITPNARRRTEKRDIRRPYTDTRQVTAVTSWRKRAEDYSCQSGTVRIIKINYNYIITCKLSRFVHVAGSDCSLVVCQPPIFRCCSADRLELHCRWWWWWWSVSINQSINQSKKEGRKFS